MVTILPSDFQQVEYIQSTGSEYITLPAYRYTGTIIEFDVQYTNTTGNDKFGFASAETNAEVKNGILGSASKFLAFYGTCGIRIDTGVSISERHIFKYEPTAFYIDNQEILSDSDKYSIYSGTIYGWGSFQNNNAIKLFGSNGEETDILSTCKIYSFKVTSRSGRVIFNLIPCYRKEDKAIGMYDLINEIFYPNEGTGQFLKGKNISTSDTYEIDWSESMKQEFEYYEVDPNTWKDIRLLDSVTSASINRDLDTDTLESASLDLINTLGECYVRIYLVTIQNDYKKKHCLGTFLLQTPSVAFDGKYSSTSVDAYSPLLELKENNVSIGFSLLKNSNILDDAYTIMSSNMRGPIVKSSSDKTLAKNFVSSGDEKWISFVSDLVASAKYEIGLDELGRVIFKPIQTIEQMQPVYTYNDDNSSILYPDLTMSRDLYSVPNVVEVYYTNNNLNLFSVIKNEDPNSITSIQNRGREIIYRITNPDMHGTPTQEMLDEYAEEMLKEVSSLTYKINYTHGYCPVRVGDCVRLNYRKAGLKNIKAKVISQSISCRPGCSVSETAIFTSKLWK